MPTERPKTTKTTRSFRCAPDIAKELDKYPWGGISEVIDKALRCYWKMAPRDSAK